MRIYSKLFSYLIYIMYNDILLKVSFIVIYTNMLIFLVKLLVIWDFVDKFN